MKCLLCYGAFCCAVLGLEMICKTYALRCSLLQAFLLIAFYAPFWRREGILLCCCLSVGRSISSFRSFSSHWLHILKWNLVYRFIVRILRSSSIWAILDRVMALELRKIAIICSFRSFSLHWIHILKWNLIHRFIMGISRSSSVLGKIEPFWTELWPLDFEKFQ
jgi:hypothetical protein